MSPNVHEHLADLAALLRRFLKAELPKLGGDWWHNDVLRKLSYQQRTQAEEQQWSGIDDLDVAATFRIVDQNWDHFRQRGLVKWDDRNWLKEALSVRNRYSHDAPGREPSAERVYRDIDTLALLADALDSGSEEAELLSRARAEALAELTPQTDAVPASENIQETSPGAPGGFVPGALVRLKARPELTGVVTQVEASGSQMRLKVFHGSVTQTYFESQVELVDSMSAEHLSAEEMKAKLAAAHVLHPSVNRLYSLNSGRIDYEPYQYRPVMKLINADRPRLLIADDVGVG